MTMALSHALRTAIAKPRSRVRNSAMVFGSIAVPLALRLILDRGTFGAQFAFIYPAALAIAILCGWRWALASGIGGMLATFHFLVRPSVALPRDWGDWGVLVTVSIALCAIVFVGQVLRTTVNELDEAKLEVETLNGELVHRSKNALQLVQALASGAKRSADPRAFYLALEGRLQALASANQLLKYGTAESCSLHEAIANAVRPFERDRIKITGENCQVERGSVVALSLALHELATNATKYGALSNDIGSVSISCERDCLSACHVLVRWVETGGPQVVPPSRRGMGTRLLASQKAFHVVRHEYDPAGVNCLIRLPIALAGNQLAAKGASSL